MKTDTIYRSVEQHYSSVAGSSDDRYSRRVAKAFGYSEQELKDVPQGANLGLSCGNPLVIANLQEGETVVDLGSGAGFDVFLAAKKVGSNGTVIGIDMNKEMLARANSIKEKNQAKNVTFVESKITQIKLDDNIADCVISNCVINLVPEEEKHLVFEEIFRILKHGGRVAVSDILAKKELPQDIKNSMVLYLGCIAGASKVHDYKMWMERVGFEDVLIVDGGNDLNVYSQNDDVSMSSCCNGESSVNCCSEQSTDRCSKDAGCSSNELKKVRELARRKINFNEFAGSFKIYALKP